MSTAQAKEKRPKVSVCLAAYNGVAYIHEQIESVLRELADRDELIVSDNGSTDGTVAAVLSFDDPRIRLLHCAERGVAANFQCALTVATGDIIVLCDQDDVWLPGRIEAALTGLSQADLSVVGYTAVDEHLRELKCNLRLPQQSLLATLMVNGYTGCCMAIKRRVLSTVLPFPTGMPMHDWWIAVLCLATSRVNIDASPYILYRRHGANVSDTGGRSETGFIRRVGWRVRLMFDLLLRLSAVKSRALRNYGSE